MKLDEPREPLKFARENGEELLRSHFGDVERHDFEGGLVFPRVPEISGPFGARMRHATFVANGTH